VVQLEERCATRNWHSLWDGQPLCNGAAQVETQAEKLTGDAGFCRCAKRWPTPPCGSTIWQRVCEDPRDPQRTQVVHARGLRSRFVAGRPPLRVQLSVYG